jgi:hypothetical protein
MATLFLSVKMSPQRQPAGTPLRMRTALNGKAYHCC